MRDVLLHEYITECSDLGFQWGQRDCVLFSCTWAERLCGKNPAKKESYGAYSDEKGAYAHLEKEYGSIHEGFDKCFSRINPVYAKKGDIVLAKIRGLETCGIVGDRGYCWFKTESKGMICIRPLILCAWSVE